MQPFTALGGIDGSIFALSKECAAIAGCSPRDQIYLAEATHAVLSPRMASSWRGRGGRMDGSCAFHLFHPFKGVNSSFGTREEGVFPRDFLDF